MHKAFIRWVLAIISLPATIGATLQPSSLHPSTGLAEFTQRVNAYAELRQGVEEGETRRKHTDEPAQAQSVGASLADKIRAARTDAALGDIFNRQTRAMFRRLMKAQLRGSNGAEYTSAAQEEDLGAIALQVNAPYQAAEPLSIVPPDILKAFPVLPEDLEYRFVGEHLILYDARAGLVVDFIPNAIS